ncbi:MAG TPA: hypothetical protein VKU87_10700, partial [Thermomicrobiaceae bacterium]|nr:hypothetical protein [Thermomicrobiaceae bacterium]
MAGADGRDESALAAGRRGGRLGRRGSRGQAQQGEGGDRQGNEPGAHAPGLVAQAAAEDQAEDDHGYPDA